MKNRKILRIIRAALLFVIFLCLILIIRECCLSINHRIQQKKLEEKLQAEYDGAEEGQKYPEIESVSGQTIEDMKQELKMETEPVILEKYAGLYEENSDLTGWLSIEGMKINYPVMQCEDDEYYLHHDFYGNEDKYGCLYVRETADVNTPGTNFVIYGHNMRDGSMFGDLDFYKEEDFFKEHSVISFDTLYEERTYEIVVKQKPSRFPQQENPLSAETTRPYQKVRKHREAVISPQIPQVLQVRIQTLLIQEIM